MNVQTSVSTPFAEMALLFILGSCLLFLSALLSRGFRIGRIRIRTAHPIFTWLFAAFGILILTFGTVTEWTQLRIRQAGWHRNSNGTIEAQVGDYRFQLGVNGDILVLTTNNDYATLITNGTGTGIRK